MKTDLAVNISEVKNLVERVEQDERQYRASRSQDRRGCDVSCGVGADRPLSVTVAAALETKTLNAHVLGYPMKARLDTVEDSGQKAAAKENKNWMDRLWPLI